MDAASRGARGLASLSHRGYHGDYAGERGAEKESRGGRGFAASIERILNAHVRRPGDDVVVARARVDDVTKAIGSELEARLLLKDLVLGVHRPCTGKSVKVANSGMLIALRHPPGGGCRLLAAIDSSASIHDRHPEVCFWSLALRAVCRFVFVTQDRDVYRGRRSELGRSCEQGSAARKLLETLTDGVYVSK